MKIRLLTLLLAVFTGNLYASGSSVCTGNPQLGNMRGLWILDEFSDRLSRTHSWNEAATKGDSQYATIRIDGNSISFNLQWHEGDSSEGNCVRLQSGKLWARPGWESTKWYGPYSKAESDASTNESAYFLNRYFVGCFQSELQEHWCITSSDITVDGRSLGAEFKMDPSEGPLYGTAFRVQGRRLPFLVFVPISNGFAVFEDDFLTSETRVEVDVTKSKPWRKLTKISNK